MKDEMFEKETIDCPPNMGGLFRYAETIISTEVGKDRGRDFVLEMLKYGKQAYLKAKKPTPKKGGEL